MPDFYTPYMPNQLAITMASQVGQQAANMADIQRLQQQMSQSSQMFPSDLAIKQAAAQYAQPNAAAQSSILQNQAQYAPLMSQAGLIGSPWEREQFGANYQLKSGDLAIKRGMLQRELQALDEQIRHNRVSENINALVANPFGVAIPGLSTGQQQDTQQQPSVNYSIGGQPVTNPQEQEMINRVQAASAAGQNVPPTAIQGAPTENPNLPAAPMAGPASPQIAPQSQTPADQINLPGFNNAWMKTQPVALQNAVKMVVDGQMDPPSPNSRSPIARQVYAALVTAYPSYDAVEFAKRKATNMEFTKGATGQNAMNAAQAVKHLSSYVELANAIQNGQIPIINAAVNHIRAELGNDTVTNPQVAIQAIGSELGRTFRGTGNMSEKESEDWSRKFSVAASPQQMMGAASEAANLLNQRINLMNERYKSGFYMDGKLNGPDFFDKTYPSVKPVLQNLLSLGGKKQQQGVKFLGFE